MEAESPRSTGLYDLLGWFEANKKRVAIAVGALLAAALVAGLFVWQKGQREIDAEHALASVFVPFAPSEPIPPGTGDAFAKVAEEHSGTTAAPKARIRAGTAYFGENKLDKATEQFQKVLNEHGDSDWVPQAVFGLAATLEAQGKTTEAISSYKNFAEKYPTDPAVDQAKLNLARLYEQTKQPALAHEVLKKIAEGAAMAFTPGAQEAQERLRALETAHPELRPPPPMNPNMMNMFSNLPPAVQTNAPKLLTISNNPATPNTPAPAANPGAAPTIIPQQGTNK